MIDENDLTEMFVSIHLSVKTDGHLIRIKRYPPYKSDTLIMSAEELEKVMEITKAKAKQKADELREKTNLKRTIQNVDE